MLVRLTRGSLLMGIGRARTPRGHVFAKILMVVLAVSLGFVMLAESGRAADRTVLPGIHGEDERRLTDSTTYPWRAIGRVNRTTGGFCTGTVVAPFYVLTAAHCLWNKRAGKWLRPDALHFLAGYNRGAYVAHATVTDYQLAPGHPGHPNPQRASAVHDWALLRLSSSMADVTGIIPLMDIPAGELTELGSSGESEPPVGTVLQAGYSQDKAHILSRHDPCAVVSQGYGGALIYHSCDATRGDSGSPLLVRTADQYAVFALHVATGLADGRAVGVAVAAGPILQAGHLDDLSAASGASP
jgi:protease YdgD